MYDVTKQLLELFAAAGISYYVFEEPFADVQQFDLGLRGVLIPMEKSPYEAIIQRVLRLKGKSLYRLKDVFHTQYALIKLPVEAAESWLSVGPVLIGKPSGEEILSLIRQLNLPNSVYGDLDSYYDRLPQFQDQEVFDRINLCIADSIFGGKGQYAVKVINNSPEPDILQQIISRTDPLKPESGEDKTSRIQLRYDLENEFLRKVKTGNIREALSAYYRFIQSFQNNHNFKSGFYRMQDQLRDAKDIAVTLNTLLRKAAEESGVPPFFIDSFSNSSILRIEQFRTTEELRFFYPDLIAGYCNLVQEYALNHYAPQIQSAMRIIQSDLSADLSLSAVAAKLNLNRNYLSDLFRRETGESFSAYVLKKRVQQAKHLLATTPLPVQDIACAVGIPDASYFARLFRRETGHSPKYFRGKQIDHPEM